MANVYTTKAAIIARTSTGRVASLCARDSTDDPDAVLAAAIELAGRRINRSLRQRFGSAVPFRQIGDSPSTPEEIQKIAEDLVLFDLYSYSEPGGRDAEHHRAMAQEAIEALKDGTEDIAVARARAHEGRVIAVYDAEAPVFGDVDSGGISRTRGI